MMILQTVTALNIFYSNELGETEIWMINWPTIWGKVELQISMLKIAVCPKGPMTGEIPGHPNLS